eukprot:1434150-Ditylum_brightwellii.AAC.1
MVHAPSPASWLCFNASWFPCFCLRACSVSAKFVKYWAQNFWDWNFYKGKLYQAAYEFHFGGNLSYGLVAPKVELVHLYADLL